MGPNGMKRFYFPIGILGQVWYLIASIPDLCTLSYGAVTYKRIKLTDAEWTENLQKMFIR